MSDTLWRIAQFEFDPDDGEPTHIVARWRGSGLTTGNVHFEIGKLRFCLNLSAAKVLLEKLAGEIAIARAP